MFRIGLYIARLVTLREGRERYTKKTLDRRDGDSWGPLGTEDGVLVVRDAYKFLSTTEWVPVILWYSGTNACTVCGMLLEQKSISFQVDG